MTLVVTAVMVNNNVYNDIALVSNTSALAVSLEFLLGTPNLPENKCLRFLKKLQQDL